MADSDDYQGEYVNRGETPTTSLAYKSMKDEVRYDSDGTSRARAQWALPRYYRNQVEWVRRGALPEDCFRCGGNDERCPLVDDDPADWRACPHAM